MEFTRALGGLYGTAPAEREVLRISGDYDDWPDLRWLNNTDLVISAPCLYDGNYRPLGVARYKQFNIRALSTAPDNCARSMEQLRNPSSKPPPTPA